MRFTVDKTSDGINAENNIKEFNTLEELIDFVKEQDCEKIVLFANKHHQHIEIYDDYRE